MRKTFTILSFLICALSSKAQNDFTQHWDALFKHVALPGSLQTGFFAKLAIADSSLNHYTGATTDSWAYYSQWSNAYQFAELSAVQPLPLKPYDSTVLYINTLQKNGKLPLALLALQYGDFAPQAFSKKAIQYDSLQNVFLIGDLQQAFSKNDLFVCAPTLATVFTSSVDLYIDSNLVFNAMGSGIKSIEIMHGNQSFVQMPFNQNFTIQLLEGANPLVFRVVFLNGKVKVSRSSIYCDLTDYLMGNTIHKRIGDPMHIGDIRGNIFAEPVRPTELGGFLGACVQVLPGYDAKGGLHTCAQKPLIIVEGIDFGFKDHWNEYYGQKCGNIGLIDLLHGYVYNPYAEKADERRTAWKAIEKAPLLLDSLRRQGFDIYYLDFHNGAEYMENNAQLLEELIRQINILKCSDEELVVLGCSMGGVLAKYALADMESRNVKHCVRTFLSFDAPHQGANIPFGLQAFLETYQGKLPIVKESLKRKINRAATRQLLIQHILSDQKTGPHKDRDEWLKLANALPYPKMCRNIVISNGSIDGSYQNFNQGDELLILNPINAQIDDLPLRWNSTVFAMSHWMSGTLFKDPKEIVMHTQLGPVNFVKTVEPSIYADHLPGSLRSDLIDFRAIYVIFNIVNLHSSTCFIPTYSALDLPYEKRDSIAQILAKGQTQVTQKFSAVYGVENTNQEHMEITDNNMHWLFNELLKNQNELPYVVSTYYNYGFSERNTMPSMNIQKNGHVQINGDQLTRHANAAFRDKNKAGSRFEMCNAACNAMVMIDKGGVLELGDDNIEMNTANLTIKSGSILWIRDGGHLIVNNGSRLVIEPGAKLMYDQGALITLEGNDASLMIKGQLELQDLAVFSVGKGNASMTGYVAFSNPNQQPQNACVIASGKNAQLDLSGLDATSDVVLQIDGQVQFGSAQFPLASVSIKQSKMIYNENSQINTFGNLTLQDVVLEMVSGLKSNQSNALIVQLADSVNISDVKLSGFENGIQVIGQTAKNNRMTINRSLISNCTNAFQAKSVQLTANALAVMNSNTGMALSQLESDAIVTNCQISNCKTGLSVSEREHAELVLSIQACDFVKNQIGLSLNQCHTAIACSRFVANGIGLQDDFGTLTLSEHYSLKGLKAAYMGGNNTFAYHQQYAIKLQGTWLYMHQGKNNFMATESAQAPYNFIVGDIAYSAETHYTSAPYALKAADNYWKNYSGTNIASGVYQWYLVKFPHPTAGALTLNEFDGTVLGALNTYCLNTQNNGGICDRVMHQMDSAERDLAAKPLESVLMPLPAAQEVTIQITQSNNDWHMVKLINAQGQILKEQLLNQDRLSWTLEDVVDGLYYISISNGFETIAKPLIVKRF